MKTIHLMAAIGVLLGLALLGCSNDSTTSAQFAGSTTPPAPGLVKMSLASASGTQVLVNVLLFGPEPALDLNAISFAIRISDPSAVRFLPQTTYVQSALVASDGQRIAIDVDGASDPSLVNVQIAKLGGGAGNGFTSPSAVVIQLSFEVVGSGGAALSFSGVGRTPAQAFDSNGRPLDDVLFDRQGATIAAVRTGGGGY